MQRLNQMRWKDSLCDIDWDNVCTPGQQQSEERRLLIKVETNQEEEKTRKDPGKQRNITVKCDGKNLFAISIETTFALQGSQQSEERRVLTKFEIF